MSYMQIDSSRHKRPRSPASPSPDRPFKRVAVTPGSAGRTPSPLLSHTTQQVLLSTASLQIEPPSMFQERKTSDDWVTRTSGLKLDSPLFGTGHAGSPSLPEESGKWDCTDSAELSWMEDEQMSTDPDNESRLGRSSWSPSPSLGHITPQSNFHHSHSPATISSPMYSTIPAQTVATAQSDIRIHVYPATPSHRGPRRSATNQSGPMSISPSVSGVWESSTSSRKPRVSMGPRPDCEKCKSGMKGHWMHID